MSHKFIDYLENLNLEVVCLWGDSGGDYFCARVYVIDRIDFNEVGITDFTFAGEGQYVVKMTRQEVSNINIQN